MNALALKDVDIPVHNYTIEMVPVAKLSIDTTYHAEGRYNQNRAEKMGRTWDDRDGKIVDITENERS